jgi:DNA ligase D-like protein (predicted 3'-phosphoesterase)
MARELSLLGAVKKYLDENRDEDSDVDFVGWLSGRERIGGHKAKQTKPFREGIYVPILQYWIDDMLKEKDGDEKYKINEWLTNEELDGIPHIGGGAYFVSRVEENNNFDCNLKVKTREDGETIRTGASDNPKLLKVLNMWKLNEDDVKLLTPNQKAGTEAIKDITVLKSLVNGKSNESNKIKKYNFKNVSIKSDNIAPGDYVLVRALIIPDSKNFGPMTYIRNMRKDEVFEELKELSLNKKDAPTFWKLVREEAERLRGRDPEEAKEIFLNWIRQKKEEDEIIKEVIEPARKKPITPIKKVELKPSIKTQEIPDAEIIKIDPKFLDLKDDEIDWDIDDEQDSFVSKFKSPKGLKKIKNIPKKASAGSLSEYQKKRKFDNTDEPDGKVEKKNKHRFVIQLHEADRAKTHFDLRLENDDGAMSSWAVPKHKLPTKEKLLAVKTEDHPVSYNKFEGEIPKGEYGAGTVEIYDSGTYEEIEWSPSKIIFKLKGKKEDGTYNLIKTDGKRWLLMKAKEK